MSDNSMPPTLFFAGTDTDVGKTYTAALVVAALRSFGKGVAVYKPVASGCQDVDGERIASDAAALWQAAGRPRSLTDVCPQRFAAPLAPPRAAAIEGKFVNAALLRDGADVWQNGFELLVVEGAGGLMSPLADGVLNIDLVQRFPEVQLVIVAANRLGAIHQTLATCEAAISRGQKPVGIVLCNPKQTSDESTLTNAVEIQSYTDIPVLGEIPYAADTQWAVPIAKKLCE